MINLSPESTTITRADRTTNHHPTSRWIIVCLSSLFAVACSSDDSNKDGEEVEQALLQGELSVREKQAKGQREMSLMAGFSDYASNAIMRMEILDKCTATNSREPGSNQSDRRAIPPLPISAGPLIINNPAGTFATLTYNPMADDPSDAYTSDSIAVTAE